MAVLPADHYIAQPERYRKIVRAALDVSREPGRMVVLGIPPTRPETGFGYIERDESAAIGGWISRLSRLPVHGKTGTRFGQRICCLRNVPVECGNVLLARLHVSERAATVSAQDVSKPWNSLSKHIGKRSYETQLKKIYPKLENISVDYAILEKAATARQVSQAEHTESS